MPTSLARNTLALSSSPDVREWKFQSIVPYRADSSSRAFQYVEWLFERDDIVFACRTAYDDGLGGAHRPYDANLFTVHHLKDCRKRTMADSDQGYLKRAIESK